MIRRRTPAEKALAFVRRLNAPREREQKRAREEPKPNWPERGAIEELFREARRNRA